MLALRGCVASLFFMHGVPCCFGGGRGHTFATSSAGGTIISRQSALAHLDCGAGCDVGLWCLFDFRMLCFSSAKAQLMYPTHHTLKNQ